MKAHSSCQSLLQSSRHSFNPIRNLTPERLSQVLDAFHNGHLAPAAKLWESIERRDDVLQGVISKRKNATSRLRWEILTLDNTPEALSQKAALEYFYNHLSCTNACDPNEHGGLALLIKQMMDAIGKQYAIHEIILQPTKPYPSATFQFVPLWYFERKNGQLHFLSSPESQSLPIHKGSWLVTKGEGLMESSSIAYLFKHLPLRDWLIYCERNGMPGVKGSTHAMPGTAEWEAAKAAVADFSAEFHALVSDGTQIEAIDLSSRGTLPYPQLVDRMDRALIALWRGSDLSTLSKKNATGASLQDDEAAILEAHDSALISETLNFQVDRILIKQLFQSPHPKAYFHLLPQNHSSKLYELEVCQKLHALGFPLSQSDLSERFGFAPSQKPSQTLPPSP
jgi:phage gp29-like protein